MRGVRVTVEEPGVRCGVNESDGGGALTCRGVSGAIYPVTTSFTLDLCSPSSSTRTLYPSSRF